MGGLPSNQRPTGVAEVIELLHCDCMEYLAGCEDNAFELAIVDPPYGIGCAKTINIKNDKKSFFGEKLHDEKKWDDKIPHEKYFTEMQRVSKNQIVWGGNYFTDYLRPVKAWIFWDKKESKNQGSKFSDGEMAWTSFNRVTRLFQYGWIGIDYCNKWETKIHPTQKPVALYKWLLANYAKDGDRILDTHLGSGSSAIAAHYGGFDFVGMEIDKDYYEAACKRFDQETAQIAMVL